MAGFWIHQVLKALRGYLEGQTKVLSQGFITRLYQVDASEEYLQQKRLPKQDRRAAAREWQTEQKHRGCLIESCKKSVGLFSSKQYLSFPPRRSATLSWLGGSVFEDAVCPRRERTQRSQEPTSVV